MKKYEIQYWEQEKVWVRRTVEVKSEKDPSKMTAYELRYLIAEDPDSDVDWIDGDYNWETSDIVDYDFETDFACKEVE